MNQYRTEMECAVREWWKDELSGRSMKSTPPTDKKIKVENDKAPTLILFNLFFKQLLSVNTISISLIKSQIQK